MNRHLDDDQIAAAVAGLGLEPDAQSHLGSCLSCRQQVEDLKGLIGARRQELLSDEPDWERQREEILRRLPGAAGRRRRGAGVGCGRCSRLRLCS